MKSILPPVFSILLAVVVVSLDSVSSNYFPNAANLLDLPLIALVYFTLTQDRLLWILLLGTFIGMLQDGQTVQLLGLHGLGNISVCSLIYLTGKVISLDGWVIRSLILCLAFVASSLISWGLRVSFLDQHATLYFGELWMGALVCALAGLTVFSLVDNIAIVKKWNL